MPHPLDGCHTKLARADELHHELFAEIARWHESGGGQIVGEYRPRTREYVYVARVTHPPLRWGAILGDWAHNLRSALDLLMWQLVLHGDGNPTRRTQFPIFLRRARYRARAPAMLAGVRRGVRGKVERLQPFHGSRRVLAASRALAMLAWISNTDKHRFLHPTTTGIGIELDAVGTITGVPNDDAGAIRKESWYPLTELLDGTDVVRFRIDPCGPTPVVELTHRIHVAVAFGRTRLLSPHFLAHIRTGVGHVFEVLGPEFDID